MERFVHNANIEHYRRLPAPAREMLFAAVHESLVVEGFGCRPIAALRLGPRPASESRQGRNPREMSGGGAASAALWIFVYDGSACWRPTLMSVLADDVAAHDGSVAGR
jgi:hypothetical protein